VDGERGGQPKQGKPLIEVLFPKSGPTGSSSDQDLLNKTEREFLGWIEGNLAYHRLYIQEIRLRLAKKTWYLPDFIVWGKRGEWKVFEVKGFMRDDAAVKLKVAAEKYREFQFILVTKKKQKDGGGWDFKVINP
jgi:hypothetical protein